MRAHVGDKIVTHGHKVGTSERVGHIVEVRGPSGEPPFLVEWDGTPGSHLFFPGSDAEIKPERTDSSPEGE
jgi:hypothetical protein